VITAHFVGVPAITANHVNGKRGSLLGGAGRGCNHVQNTDTMGSSGPGS